jgi:transposase
VSPQQPGARGTTNRRAALQLARLRRSGALPPVDVPQVEEEALRDLGRARAEAIRALKAAPCRLKALRLRQAIRDTGQATWSPAPLRGRSEGVWPPPAQPRGCQAYGRAVTEHTARLERLAPARKDQGLTWRRRPGLDALPALRGVQGTVAVTAGADLGERTRFDHPSQLMRALGLPPSASSPGDRRRQGGSPQAGQTQARRALLAGAWASRSPATVRRHLQRRLEQGSKPIQDRRGQAQGRRCKRDRQVRARGTTAHQVGVTIARALSACMSAMAQAVPRTPSPAPIASPASVLTRR